MKSKLHGQYLIQLARLGNMFNCYLVREEDGLTLIDTNLPGSARGILAAARQEELPIVRILLTHAHGDHVASLDALQAALSEVEVALTPREARFLAGERSLDPGEPPAKLRGGYQTCQTVPTLLLEPGDRVGSLEVVPSPGHTPGHAAFLDIRDRTLIAGDAFQTQAGLAVAGMVRWLFPFPAMGTWHAPTALRSAQALHALNPNRLAVGHGPVLAEPLAAMDRAIQAAEQRFQD